MTIDIEHDETFGALFGRVQRSLLDTMRNAKSGESPDRTFDAVLNVLTAQFGDFAELPTVTEWVRSGHVDPTHPIRLHAYDYGDGLRAEVDLNEGLSIDGRHRALARHIEAAVRAAGADPDSLIGAVALAGPDDLTALSELVPRPPAPAADQPVHETIRARLRSDPDRVVAECDGVQLSACEFDSRADRLADWLVEQGAEIGSRVGIRMERSVEVLIALQGVLRAGAVFVMMDPQDPPSRHAAIEADADLLLVLDELPTETADRGLTNRVVTLDDLAYVLYTSGSTGVPKGVPISHRGLADYLRFAVDTYGSDTDPPVVALHSSLGLRPHDHQPLPVVPDRWTGDRLRGDPVVALGRIAVDDRVTFLKATPSQLEILARMVDEPRPIRTVVVGGEAFRRPVAVATAGACHPDVRIFNEYGPTEAVVGCMIHEWDPEIDVRSDVPIGQAAPGCEIALLDRFGQPAVAGAWGELYVRRAGMATGYLHRPDLTAERFVELADVPGQWGVRSRSVVPNRRPRPPRSSRCDGVRRTYGRPDEGQRGPSRARRGRGRTRRASAGGDRAGPVVDPGRTTLGASVRTLRARNRRPRRRDRRRRRVFGVPLVRRRRSADRNVVQDRIRPRRRLVEARARSTGDYDCLHLLSGGKDSSYALYQLVERGWRVHALTLDNGFISEGAKENIRRSIDALGITHEFATTAAMNEIFRDSLERYSNVCQGCYKTIYTLGVARAAELGIPVVVTGLSRGQFFETRLIPAQFEAGRFDPDAIDATVLEARKVYHRQPDAVTELLPEQRVFDDDRVFDEIEFLDFYRYVDVDLAELYRYLEANAPWVRPADTGRSTNCLINVAGIQVHLRERGYHNYAEPYSWDVRLGHKTRDEALEELDDEVAGGVDDPEVRLLLDTVGYRPKQVEILTAWYQTVDGVDIDPDELRRQVRRASLRTPFHRRSFASTRCRSRRAPKPTRRRCRHRPVCTGRVSHWWSRRPMSNERCARSGPMYSTSNTSESPMTSSISGETHSLHSRWSQP